MATLSSKKEKEEKEEKEETLHLGSVRAWRAKKAVAKKRNSLGDQVGVDLSGVPKFDLVLDQKKFRVEKNGEGGDAQRAVAAQCTRSARSFIETNRG